MLAQIEPRYDRFICMISFEHCNHDTAMKECVNFFEIWISEFFYDTASHCRLTTRRENEKRNCHQRIENRNVFERWTRDRGMDVKS